MTFKKHASIDEARKWYYENFAPSNELYREKFLKDKLTLVTEYRTTLQQLSIVSGAIATFAIMLLGTQLPIDRPLLLIGTCILLLTTVGVFGYLFYMQDSNTRTSIEFKEKILDPYEIINISAIEDLFNGRLDEFNNICDEQFSAVYSHYKNLGPQKPKTDNSNVVIFIFFFVGILMIILSLAIPALH